MAIPSKLANDVKWTTRQRLRYIEIMAYYTGVVSRSDVARAFGLSDAAATKDLKLYGDLTAGNLAYKQSVFGFVPTDTFQEIFADLSPAVVLPVIAANLAATGGPYEDEPIYGITTEVLPLPTRLPDKAVVAQITRAIKSRTKLSIEYRSLTERETQPTRIIEPHALANNGLRWHVRAYNNDTYDFRDFVLSRFVSAQLLDDPAESGEAYDDDWVSIETLKLVPHPGLKTEKREILMTDYDAKDGIIEIRVRRALLGYLLQRLGVDTTRDHSLNPNAYQLIVTNRNEIEPFAGWAFL